MGSELNASWSSSVPQCLTCQNYVQRSNDSCVSSCSLINTTTINGTSINVCEVISDTLNCPTYTEVEEGVFKCLSSCPLKTQARLCVSSCSTGFFQVNGTSCVSSCTSNAVQNLSVYTVLENGTAQCISSCAFPLGQQITALSASVSQCMTCSGFVDRSSDQCVSSCAYQNTTTINGTVYNICENGTNNTTCPYHT